MFESGWTCSAEYTNARVRSAASRELDGRGVERDGRPHRIPIGLLMLEQGWITQAQLRMAIDSQKSASAGRLGQWLIRQQAVNETMAIRALGCSRVAR